MVITETPPFNRRLQLRTHDCLGALQTRQKGSHGVMFCFILFV